MENTNTSINNNWLSAIPVRQLQHEETEEGKIVLLVPKFRWGPLKKWLQPRLKRPYMRLKLDDIASFVWRQCDGSKTTVNDVVCRMRDHFGEKAEPADARLKAFLGMLYKSKFISYVIEAKHN